ncbi:hypothetical protein [Pseudomonas fluorescens]|uniref:hypothetical protein n=1 Tax=Pseudomonas fluorescens TaxID=294 RepID=UPI003D2064B0
MSAADEGMELGDLVDREDLEVLEAEAAKRGMTAVELAKHVIQQEYARRTTPRTMSGTIQAFRRKID